MYFESHAHYDDSRFDDDRDKLLGETLPESGIDYIINVGADMHSSEESIQLSEKYGYIYAAVGVHPHDTSLMHDSDLKILEDMSKHEKVVAIGEIGLDYYYLNSPKDVQIGRFKEQLALAKELDLPVIIHSRDAAQETYDIIVNSSVKNGVIHCYSGSPEMAAEYVKMGFYIGIGGVVTYSNAKKLVETTHSIPIERILLETDCPYLSPIPKRGERNSSQNLQYICDKIAQIKQISHNETAKITLENGCKIFVVK